MNHIYIYNPTSEMALANGTISYMPPKNLQKFEEDLAFLPSFFASNEDAVIINKNPDEEFLALWQKLGLSKLTYLPVNELKAPIKYNYLCPWSWNQVVHHKFKSILPYGSDDFKSSPNYNWNPEHKDFFSRNTANRIQKIISQSFSNHKTVYIPTPAINIHTYDELIVWLEKNPKAIIKMPWSSSGRGIHIVNNDINKTTNHEWIKGAIKQQGFVTTEPLLDKVFDFSFQLNIKQNGEIENLGYSFFINDKKGHFIGGNINWPHKQDELSSFLNENTLKEASNILIEGIKTINPHHFYEGPIGVDAIVYLNKNNELRIHPCVDFNWRYNMGLININLPRFIEDTSIGKWFVDSFKPEEWNLFINKNNKEKPLILTNNKISSGFINMTPPNSNAKFGVWMEVFK